MLAQRMSNQSNADLIHYSIAMFCINSKIKIDNINSILKL